MTRPEIILIDANSQGLQLPEKPLLEYGVCNIVGFQNLQIDQARVRLAAP
jgi:hypothetical protein